MYAIGKIGVMVMLQKKNKYATVEAFSEQLCQHIATTKPSSLGSFSEADAKKMKANDLPQLERFQRDQLLPQKFISDPTIVVAEAARRSFVTVEDFLLFK